MALSRACIFDPSCFIGFKQKVSNTNGFYNRQTVRFPI